MHLDSRKDVGLNDERRSCVRREAAPLNAFVPDGMSEGSAPCVWLG